MDNQNKIENASQELKPKVPKILNGICEFCGTPADGCGHFEIKETSVEVPEEVKPGETITPVIDPEVVVEGAVKAIEVPAEDNEFYEKITELKALDSFNDFKTGLISIDSIDQMIKANELKYIENVLNVEEENKLVTDNLEDFFKYSEEIQREALAVKDKAMTDPDFFNRPGANKDLIKPIMILNNIDVKKNEAKIKNWQVEHRIRLIRRLRNIKNSYPVSAQSELTLKRVIRRLLSIFSK